MAKRTINVLQESIWDYMELNRVKKLPIEDQEKYLQMSYKENQELRKKIRELEDFITREIGYRYAPIGLVTEKHTL